MGYLPFMLIGLLMVSMGTAFLCVAAARQNAKAAAVQALDLIMNGS